MHMQHSVAALRDCNHDPSIWGRAIYAWQSAPQCADLATSVWHVFSFATMRAVKDRAQQNALRDGALSFKYTCKVRMCFRCFSSCLLRLVGKSW